MCLNLDELFNDLEVKYGETSNPNYVSINVSYENKNDNCDCGCNRCYEDIEEEITDPVTKIEMGNLDPIVAENAVTASSLRAYWDDDCEDEDDGETDDEEQEVLEEPEVKLINVNKNVSKALETIYDVISEVNEDGDNWAEFDLVEEFPELFKNVRDVTMDKVLNRISRHLTENGFNVQTHSEVNEYDNKVEKSYLVEVDW